jgi:hypothetical protein
MCCSTSSIFWDRYWAPGASLSAIRPILGKASIAFRMATRVVGATGIGSWWLFASALVLFSLSTWHWAAFHASVNIASPSRSLR